MQCGFGCDRSSSTYSPNSDARLENLATKPVLAPNGEARPRLDFSLFARGSGLATRRATRPHGVLVSTRGRRPVPLGLPIHGLATRRSARGPASSLLRVLSVATSSSKTIASPNCRTSRMTTRRLKPRMSNAYRVSFPEAFQAEKAKTAEQKQVPIVRDQTKISMFEDNRREVRMSAKRLKMEFEQKVNFIVPPGGWKSPLKRSSMKCLVSLTVAFAPAPLGHESTNAQVPDVRQEVENGIRAESQLHRAVKELEKLLRCTKLKEKYMKR